MAAVAAAAVLVVRALSWVDSTASPRLVACVAPADTADDYCPRLMDDRAARAELTNRDRMLGGGFEDKVRAALTTLPGGRLAYNSAPGEGPDADRIRQSLAAAGFTDVVVRPARASDPATTGSIVYAVRIDLYGADADAACVVGYADAEGWSGGPELVGTLPGGVCLRP